MTAPSTDVTHKSILHLQSAAESFIPTIQSLSSHLWSTLLSAADGNDLRLPPSYIDTHVCQRCGTMYIPGVTCHVTVNQSRRQKRKAKDLAWLVYECLVCSNEYKNEVELAKPQSRIAGVAEASQSPRAEEDNMAKSKKRRKRDKFQGLRSEIEKSKAAKATVKLDLQDLMKVD
jgi:RNase P subunit RPR2